MKNTMGKGKKKKKTTELRRCIHTTGSYFERSHGTSTMARAAALCKRADALEESLFNVLPIFTFLSQKVWKQIAFMRFTISR